MSLLNTYVSPASLQSTLRPKLGGFCSITYARWEDVATWPLPNPATGIIESAVVLKPGRNFYTLDATEADRLYNEQMKTGPEGKYFEIPITGKLATADETILLILDVMKSHRWVVVPKERAGFMRLIGNEDSGADFTWNYTSGDSDTSRMVDLKWTWQHPNSAPFYKP